MAQRERWGSRTAFVLAAVGSAIGLGNVWRFPYVCATHGGGAFVVAYVVALFTAGIPVLTLELALGHKYQRSICGCFALVGKRLEWLGWIAIGVAAVVVSYYAVVMGWAATYLVDSFTLAWGENASDHFFHRTLGLTSGPFDLGSLRPALLTGLIAVWCAITGCLWRGPQTVGRVVYVTVLLPWVLLAAFVWRGLTLEGAGLGLAYYLRPTVSMLLEPRVWLAAYTQVFFSLSVGLGTMVAYGSYLPRRSSIVSDVYVVAAADAATALTAGVAVFGALGYLSHRTGVPIEDLSASGPGLAFVAYPTIVSELPAFNAAFGVLFFFMLLALGIDSAFSLAEGVASAVRDKFGWHSWPAHRRTNVAVALACCLAGLPFVSGAGLYWVDLVDYFMNFFGLAAAVLIECVVVGWVLGARTIVRHLDTLPGQRVGRGWEGMVRYVAPAVVASLLVTEAATRLRRPYGGYPRSAEAVAAALVFLVIPAAAWILARAGGDRG